MKSVMRIGFVIALVVGGEMFLRPLCQSQDREAVMEKIVVSSLGQSGELVSDDVALQLYGAASIEAECSGWEDESGGCITTATAGGCPDDFTIFNDFGESIFANYYHSKVNTSRECDGGNNTLNCNSGVTDSIIGCTVGP